MSGTSLTVTATFEDGALHPDTPLPLVARQRVTLVVQIPESDDAWPANVAEIYEEMAAKDRSLAAAMFPAMEEACAVAEQ